MSNDPSMAHNSHSQNIDDGSTKKTPNAITGKQSLISNDRITDQINDKSYEFIHGASAITKSNGDVLPNQPRKILRKGDGLQKKAPR